MVPRDDHFTPDNVDEQIDAFFQMPTDSSARRSPTSSKRLVDDLQHIHQGSSNNDAQILQRAWQRLAAADQAEEVSQQSTQVMRPVGELRSRQEQFRRRGRFFLSPRLTSLAAVLVISLLLGSFVFAISHVSQSANVPTPHPTPIPTSAHISSGSTPIDVPTLVPTATPIPTTIPTQSASPTAIATTVATNTPTSTTTIVVKPVAECVVLNGDGSYIAYFGYLNPDTSAVTIPAGGNNNYFVPGPADRGQPAVFNPGRQFKAFHFLVGGGTIVWFLNGHTSTLSSQSTIC